MRQELLPEFKPYQQPVIAGDKVRYVGEPIAVVVADSAALAEDALDAIALDIEALPAVADRAAARSNESLLFEATGRNHIITLSAHEGRRRGGVPRRALHPPRALQRAALQRGDRWSRAACSPNGTRRRAISPSPA